MATIHHEAWQPDWATHPGEHLAEHLEERGVSSAEFARLSGISPELIAAIVAGSAPVSPEIASKLQHSLGLKADVWLSLQMAWERHQASDAKRAN